jgi:putative membrane protein
MSEPTEEPHVPGSVDARFTLAAERTVLSWIRTSLGLIAAGMAILHVLPSFSSSGVRDVIGIGLVALGALASVIGGLRWRQTTEALRRGGPMPGPFPVWLLIGILVVLSVTVLGATIVDP